MKTKRASKVLSLILVMLMLIGITPAVVSAAEPDVTSDGYKYSISNGKVTITGYTGKKTTVHIPETIDNCPVTKVSSYAFIGNRDITVVVYPKGVTAVELISFASCTSLQSIHLPDTVTTIGNSAFFGCTKLVNISIPKNVEVIGNSAFQKCESLTSITLPESVKSIGGLAFAECTKLKTINIPEGVTTIAESTFEKCTSLRTIEIPASVTSIHTRAFYYCSGLKDVYFNGTREQWDAIEGSEDSHFRHATIHCIEEPEKSETTENPYEPEVPETTVDPYEPEEPTETPEAIPSPAPIKGTLKVEVVGGTGFSIALNGGAAKPQGIYYTSEKMLVGTTVTLVANGTAEFCGWMNESGTVLSTEKTYTFVTSGCDILKAVFKEEVIGVNCVKFVNEKAANGKGQVISSQYYSPTEIVMFPDAPAQVGYEFKGWSMTSAEIQNFLGQGKDVTVTAVWEIAKDYINLTVNGGKVTEGVFVDGMALAYNAYTAEADTAPQGKKFAYWTDGEGRVVSYDTQYKFYPVTNTTLTAVFVTEDTEIEYKAIVTLSADPSTIGKKIAYTLSWDVSNVGDVVAVGVIIVNKKDYNESTFYHGTDDTAVFDRGLSGSNLKDADVYNIVKSGCECFNTYVARTWMIYKDANGTEQLVYSDITETYKPCTSNHIHATIHIGPYQPSSL